MSDETKQGSKGWVWAVVLAVIVASALLVPQRENPSPTGPVGTPLTPAVRAVLKGDWNAADAALRRAKPQLAADSLEARQLPLLERVVAVWSVQPLDKEQAAQALRELEGAKPLPSGMTAWIQLQRSKRDLAP